MKFRILITKDKQNRCALNFKANIQKNSKVAEPLALEGPLTKRENIDN